MGKREFIVPDHDDDDSEGLPEADSCVLCGKIARAGEPAIPVLLPTGDRDTPFIRALEHRVCFARLVSTEVTREVIESLAEAGVVEVEDDGDGGDLFDAVGKIAGKILSEFSRGAQRSRRR